MDPRTIYHGSDGQATTELYKLLETKGPVGVVAENLFRACKASARAKVYRGGIRGRGSYKSMAYEKKQWFLSLLCETLGMYGNQLGISWGWKEDPEAPVYRWILYVDIPTGQVSFHSEYRGDGPDYPGDWCGQHDSAEKIIAWTERVIEDKTDGTAATYLQGRQVE